MPGIEFVGDDTGENADEDVLDTGPRRPVPRWVWVVAALAVVAAALGVIVSARDDHENSARPTPTPTPSTAGPSDAGPGTPVVGLAADGSSLYWLAGDRLHRGGGGGHVAASTPVSQQELPFDEAQLVADPQERTIWVVSFGSSADRAGTGVVEGFAADDLHRTVHASTRAPVTGASVLNGALFVLSAGRLLRITADATRFTQMAKVDLSARELVTAGGSLLFAEGGNGSAIGRWTPSGLDKPVVLETVDNALAVAGSTVFVLGTVRGQGPELNTLDPLTDKVDQQALATGLDGDLKFVATGRRSVIVLGSGQGTGRGGPELACVTTADPVDAPGPAKVQALAVATSPFVTVLGDRVFQADGGTVRPVAFDIGRCST
ncbi:hypothetical protein [uncultured Jatrophihabitans sp.]|uniref:hypothetical protein n=1 Tax=uncultured Jatrophihabitans sp. TaxID=1610747 RepID=UPI0035CB4FFD